MKVEFDLHKLTEAKILATIITAAIMFMAVGAFLSKSIGLIIASLIVVLGAAFLAYGIWWLVYYTLIDVLKRDK